MRPTLRLLDEQQIEQIVADARAALARVGVRVENAGARQLLLDAGQRATTDDERIHIDEAAVDRALDSAPGRVHVHDRDGALALRLGDDALHFDPGSTAVRILDPVSGRHREPSLTDCDHLAWVTQACSHLAAQSTALAPARWTHDGPARERIPAPLGDRLRLHRALSGCSKPVVTGTFVKEGFATMRRMLELIRGGSAALRERPLALFDCCPTPPLTWSDLTCQSLMDCARAGIPAILVAMPMAGASAPVTLRDAVVQHCAENLSGVVIHQLCGPGAPVVWGGSPAAVDMRHGTTPMGAMETQLIDVAYAAVGKHLGLPTHAYMALSDAKQVGWQAGMESASGAVLAALAGVDLVSGPGMLDYESCQSLEKLCLDDEICALALRLSRGISAGSAVPAVELLAEAVQRGEMLSSPHTRRHHRTELDLPGPLVERASHGDWEARGGPTAPEKARGLVEHIVAQGNPAPLAAGLQAELERLMLADCRAHGIDALPPS